MEYQVIKEYYGKVLKGSADLQTDACCTVEAPPQWLRALLRRVHPEVADRYYGCGLVAPELLTGLTILDLGCGAGRDVYVLAQMVGAQGRVIGLDMTEEQLEVARRHREWHAHKAGFAAPNTEFITGYMEDLTQVASGSVDVVVSNCVINLSPDKNQVLREIFRVLKPGGELYFSDIYSDRRMPSALRQDELLWGECLSGALYWHDFLDLAKATGFGDPRLVHSRPLEVNNEAIKAKVSPIKFWSATYRLWKIAELETICEDYGQVVRYRGGIPNAENAYNLDAHHYFEKGQSVKVCGNTWRMLQDTRLAPYFDFWGDTAVHFGAFADCGNAIPFAAGTSDSTCSTGGCC